MRYLATFARHAGTTLTAFLAVSVVPGVDIRASIAKGALISVVAGAAAAASAWGTATEIAQNAAQGPKVQAMLRTFRIR